MAKSKPTPKPTPAPANIQKAAAVLHTIERPSNERANDALLRKIFIGTAALMCVVMLALSFGVGVNEDDKYQNDYSKKLVNWYGTMGKDSAALNVPEGYMHLYGGFFEVVTGFVNKGLGLTEVNPGYHDVRHLFSAGFGFLAILCTGLLARVIGGWGTGIFALILMFFSPRILGDAMVNPKDIPFAAAYVMALYNMVCIFKDMPHSKRWNQMGLALALGMALGIRAGGLLPFVFFLFFLGLDWVQKTRFSFSNTSVLFKYLTIGLGLALAGYVIGILFWPYALQNPIKNPFYALSIFESKVTRLRLLFEGVNAMSDKMPWYYPIKWMYMTIPLAALVGFGGAMLSLPMLWKRYQPLFLFILIFSAIFPVAYVIYKDSVLHDGWRHLTFAYPPLAALAAIFFGWLWERFESKKPLQYAVAAVFSLLLVDAAYWTVTNPKLIYSYFNPIKGGINGAFGQYETDYWGTSVRQGIEWLEQQGILNENMDQQVIIATNFFYCAKQYTAKYGDKVKIKYLKYDRRCEDVWDYGLFVSRFTEGSQLAKGFWPTDNAVHIIKASNTPILAILKDNTKNCSLGTARMKVNDNLGAIQMLKQAVKDVPDDDIAWASLGQAYLNVDSLDQCLAAAQKAIGIAPNMVQANNLIGMSYIQKNDLVKAKQTFSDNFKRDPSNIISLYYVALIEAQSGDLASALANLNLVLKNAPTFKAGYELASKIYAQQGDQARAQQFLQMSQQLK